MPRNTVDFSVLTEPLPSPEVQFADAIAEQTATMLSLVHEAEDDRSRLDCSIVQFAANTNHLDDFVRHVAMHRTLGTFGLLNEYFEAPASELPVIDGWQMTIRRTDGNSAGIFTVKYGLQQSNSEKSLAYKLFYRAR